MTYRKTRIELPDDTFIPGGLNVGTQIIVRGRIAPHTDSFDIHLRNDKVAGSDVALAFNPRIAKKVVVCNSYKGKWQNEERETLSSLLFTKGSKFTIKIYVGPTSFTVQVNGKNFIEYKHRLPYKDVRYLRLGEKAESAAEYYEATIQHLCRTPYTGEFPGGLQIGKAVRVCGSVKDNASRFEINFNCDKDDVGFHFNPRQNEGVVVLNTKIGCWQKEEKIKEYQPFQRGQYFDILFIANKGQFTIFVNKQFITNYAYRVPLENIKFLSIQGDVTLKDVEFTDPLPNDYFKVIPSGLEDNDLIVVKGFLFSEGKRFVINLINGTSLDNDIALQINPCLDESTVVIKNRECGIWKEKRHSLPRVFLDKIPFEVEIVTKQKKFTMYINGHFIASIEAKSTPENIKSVNVQGDAYIYEIKLLRRVDTPFVDKLPVTLECGSWVTIHGTPKKSADQFDINLQCDSDPQKGSDIVFCFNPRFKDMVTVLNTLTNGCWGKEEREKEKKNFPFKQEDRFEISILKLSDVFRIFVNQKFYIDYAHRVDPGCVNYVLLNGNCNFFEPEFY